MATSFIPITKVILFNNGFASFERQGEVLGDASTDLYFKSSDFSEVLKTVSLTDLDGGDICSVCYESTRQTEQQASTFNIPDSNPLLALLRSLKGTGVVIGTEDGKKTAGILIGVDDVRKGDHTGVSISLFVNTRFVLIDFSEVTTVSLLKKEVQDEIRRALDLHLSAKNKDLKRLTIVARGAGKRRIVACYSLQTHAWRSTYRINLSTADPNSAELQCFGMIDNTQDEDWENVSLSLVSGAPSSGPRAPASTDSGSGGNTTFEIKTLNGNTYSISGSASMTVSQLKSKIENRHGIPRASIRLVVAGKALEDDRALSDYNITSSTVINMAVSTNSAAPASGEKRVFRMAALDNLSTFEIANPVSVKRQQSALVPFFTAPLKVLRILTFDERLCTGNPLSGISFANETGRTLEGGSVAIYQDNKYLGESTLETMAPKDETLLTYAIDLQVELSKEIEVTTYPVHLLKASNGELKLFNHRVQRTMYTIHNKKQRTCDEFYIEHYFLDGWQLKVQTDPIDVTETCYRFASTLDPSVVKSVFNVREMTTDVKTVSLSALTATDMESWMKKDFVDEAVSKFLAEKKKQQTQINNKAVEIYEAEKNVRECEESQARLRKNIDVLSLLKKYKERYVNDLSAEEDRLKVLYAKIKQMRDSKKILDQRLETFCQSLTHSRDIPNDARQDAISQLQAVTAPAPSTSTSTAA